MEKRIVCFGDSNTWGADVENDGRFPTELRWPCQLQKLLPTYFIIEEGLCGRTTVFEDPINSHRKGLDYLVPCLETHSPLFGLILMLGTNDCKERFSATGKNIAQGMARLVRVAKEQTVWIDKPNILVIAPPPMPKEVESGFYAQEMGKCSEKSYTLGEHYASISKEQGVVFLDLNGIGKFNTKDYMHFTADSLGAVANAVAEKIVTEFK